MQERFTHKRTYDRQGFVLDRQWRKKILTCVLKTQMVFQGFGLEKRQDKLAWCGDVLALSGLVWCWCLLVVLLFLGHLRKLVWQHVSPTLHRIADCRGCDQGGCKGMHACYCTLWLDVLFFVCVSSVCLKVLCSFWFCFASCDRLVSSWKNSFPQEIQSREG